MVQYFIDPLEAQAGSPSLCPRRRAPSLFLGSTRQEPLVAVPLHQVENFDLPMVEELYRDIVSVYVLLDLFYHSHG